MTMIERIARALAASDGEDADLRWRYYTIDAQAALEAMLEPSEGMLQAAANTVGMRAIEDVMLMHQGRGYALDESAFDVAPLLQAWQAAIKAAIAER